jgi:hypothetical protein
MLLNGLYVGTMMSDTKIGEEEGSHLTFTFVLMLVEFASQINRLSDI